MNSTLEIVTDARPAETPAVRSGTLLCHVRMFKPQFAPLVEAGTKCQTVRPTPKRMPKAGDRISLRMWTGKPYRSKQRVLRESVITAVEPFDIDVMRLWKESDREAFARADGFGDWPEMLQWFISTHGYPFVGVVIKWHNAPHEPCGAKTKNCEHAK